MCAQPVDPTTAAVPASVCVGLQVHGDGAAAAIFGQSPPEGIVMTQRSGFDSSLPAAVRGARCVLPPAAGLGGLGRRGTAQPFMWPELLGGCPQLGWRSGSWSGGPGVGADIRSWRWCPGVGSEAVLEVRFIVSKLELVSRMDLAEECLQSRMLSGRCPTSGLSDGITNDCLI